jgi:acyl-CoA thioesterase
MQVRPVVHPSTGQLALVWVRFPYQLLPEVDLAPCTRAALTADAVSGFAFMTSEGVTAMNNDLSLHLHREPRGDWLAIEVERRVMREGIGVAHASLHDGDGLVGDCMVSAIAVDRPISVSPRQP